VVGRGAGRARLTIRSGGQTGVDRAALAVAAMLGLPYRGWCPSGGWAEDLPAPPGIRTRFPALEETPSADPAVRTEWNVRDGDATLILISGSDASRSPGTALTRRCAKRLAKPLMVVDLAHLGDRDAGRTWLATVASGRRDRSFELNVAGPRESEAPGIAALATTYLLELCGPSAEPHSG